MMRHERHLNVEAEWRDAILRHIDLHKEKVWSEELERFLRVFFSDSGHTELASTFIAEELEGWAWR